jgi:hypothetical protein
VTARRIFTRLASGRSVPSTPAPIRTSAGADPVFQLVERGKPSLLERESPPLAGHLPHHRRGAAERSGLSQRAVFLLLATSTSISLS